MAALFVSRQPTLGDHPVKLGQLPDAMTCRVHVRVRASPRLQLEPTRDPWSFAATPARAGVRNLHYDRLI